MSAVVLDTGALLHLERGDLKMWTLLRSWGRREVEVLVPSTVLAQSWRGSAKQARLAHALEGCSITPFDHLARQVGVLCGQAKTANICDAHVALISATSADAVYTSDPNDIARLLALCTPRNPMIVRV
jgi:rRNA-processing protein FCF1